MYVHQAVGPFGFGRTMQATVRWGFVCYTKRMRTARVSFGKTEPKKPEISGTLALGAREHQESLNQGCVV